MERYSFYYVKIQCTGKVWIFENLMVLQRRELRGIQQVITVNFSFFCILKGFDSVIIKFRMSF